mmetsp:Transcript_63155/g.73911  ORF Transcript_63155/g.73911 Transcript_63155/m.73911 type:complete len:202 (-) Transcript_63155:687-1292(-)
MGSSWACKVLTFRNALDSPIFAAFKRDIIADSFCRAWSASAAATCVQDLLLSNSDRSNGSVVVSTSCFDSWAEFNSALAMFNSSARFAIAPSFERMLFSHSAREAISVCIFRCNSSISSSLSSSLSFIIISFWDKSVLSEVSLLISSCFAPPPIDEVTAFVCVLFSPLSLTPLSSCSCISSDEGSFSEDAKEFSSVISRFK